MASFTVSVQALLANVEAHSVNMRKPQPCRAPESTEGVVSTGGAPTPAGTSVFTKHNWDMGMGYLWLNGWGIYHLMGGAFMAYWVGHL